MVKSSIRPETEANHLSLKWALGKLSEVGRIYPFKLRLIDAYIHMFYPWLTRCTWIGHFA